MSAMNTTTEAAFTGKQFNGVLAHTVLVLLMPVRRGGCPEHPENQTCYHESDRGYARLTIAEAMQRLVDAWMSGVWTPTLRDEDFDGARAALGPETV